jgi:hypothetical protein
LWERQAQEACRRLHSALFIAIALPLWALLPLVAAPAECLGLLLLQGLLEPSFG